MDKKKIIKLYQKGETAEDFDPDRSKYYYQRYKHYFEAKVLKKVLGKSIPQKLKVLDVACGTGRMLPEVFKTSKEVEYTGIDTSESMKKFLKSKAREIGKEEQIKLVQSDATKMPFKDNSFDVVFTYHLLWHIPKEDQEKIIKEMLRVVKKDGTIIFDVLNKNFIFDRAKEVLGKKGRGGIHKLSVKEAKKIIGKRKFYVEKLLDAPIKNPILYSIVNLINNFNKIFTKNFFHMLYFVVKK